MSGVGVGNFTSYSATLAVQARKLSFRVILRPHPSKDLPIFSSIRGSTFRCIAASLLLCLPTKYLLKNFIITTVLSRSSGFIFLTKPADSRTFSAKCSFINTCLIVQSCEDSTTTPTISRFTWKQNPTECDWPLPSKILGCATICNAQQPSVTTYELLLYVWCGWRKKSCACLNQLI